MFAAHVERWRYLAREEAPDLPASLVLAVIVRESNGRPGLVGSSGDLGLMQVNPVTLDTYNKNNPPISVSTMTSKDADSARLQVRAGVWVLRRGLAAVHALDPVAYPWPDAPPTDEQIRKADLVYSAGGGAFSAYRRRVLDVAGSDAFEVLASFSPGPPGLPKWARIPARKFGHARAVLAMTRGDSGGGSSPPSVVVRPPRPPVVGPRGADMGGGALVLGLVALAFAFASRKRPARQA